LVSGYEWNFHSATMGLSVELSSEVNSYGSKQWANNVLRMAIGELQGAVSLSEFAWNHSLELVLVLQKELHDYGWVWQCQVIDFWIHRYMGVRRRATSRGAVLP
jgi:hypothetical protein